MNEFILKSLYKIMGAAVTIELQKPIDASDIKSIDSARKEVTRLRNLLGILANEDRGINSNALHNDDLCLGINEMEDLNRYIDEIIHIRIALQIRTQKARRKTRHYICKENKLGDLTTQEDNDYDHDDDGATSQTHCNIDYTATNDVENEELHEEEEYDDNDDDDDDDDDDVDSIIESKKEQKCIA